jgi:hypothetical protein
MQLFSGLVDLERLHLPTKVVQNSTYLVINFIKRELCCINHIISGPCSLVFVEILIAFLIECYRMKKMQKPFPCLRMLFVLMMPLKMKSSELRI